MMLTLTIWPLLKNITLSNTSRTRVDGWWIVMATVRSRLHTSERVSAIVKAVVESVLVWHQDVCGIRKCVASGRV